MSDVKFDERWFEGRRGADLLAEKLCQVRNSESNCDPFDEITAVLSIVAELIGNTQSASRRAVRVRKVRKILPDLLRQAMQRPFSEPRHH
jgi:hypothetical protein